MRNRTPVNFLVSFGIGAVAGVLTALLFTPYSGRENRRRTAAPAEDRTHAIVTLWDTFGETSGGWISCLSSLWARLCEAVRAGREEMVRARSETSGMNT